MCGLVGVAGRIYGAEKTAFKILHFLDETRGEHSTGLATIREGTNEVKLYKAVGGVHELWDSYPDYFDDKDHTIKNWNQKVLIGHNRYATMGAKTANNAHPFHHGKIVGAHNGTLTYRWLDQLDGSDKFEVDSEAIFYSINKNGLKKTINSMHGAWALTYWDGEEQTMNFIRNKERTLYYTWSKDYKTFFWASEEWMLIVALNKAKIDAFTPTLLPVDYHYELDVVGMGLSVKKDSFLYYDEKLEGFQPPIIQTPKSYQGWWEEQEAYMGTYPAPKASKAGTNILQNAPKPEGNVYVFPNKQEKKEEDSYLTARKFQNKNVTLTIIGEREGEHVGTYLIAGFEGLPLDWEVRIFGEHIPGFEEWRKADKQWTADISCVVSRWNNRTSKQDKFLGVMVSSMKPIIHDEKPKEEVKDAQTIVLESDLTWDPNKSYKGFKGEALTFTQFMKAVNQGCLWCGEVVTPKEADQVQFVQKGRLVCGICVANGHALKYYKR